MGPEDPAPENAYPGIKPGESPVTPHKNKPKPIAGYWEPWGETLCANHSWEVDTYYLPLAVCPALPYLDTYLSLDIIAGVLTLHTWGSSGTQYLGWSEAQSGETGPNVGTLRLKVEAIATLGNKYAASWLQLYDSNGGVVRLYIVADPDKSYSGINYWIGDNGGEYQDIDLTSLGLSGRIVTIWFVHNTYASDIQIAVDYITFPAL